MTFSTRSFWGSTLGRMRLTLYRARLAAIRALPKSREAVLHEARMLRRRAGLEN